jgi:hypothetical protein
MRRARSTTGLSIIFPSTEAAPPALAAKNALGFFHPARSGRTGPMRLHGQP